MSTETFQTWKVIHGYGIFLGFINYFMGLKQDELSLSKQQKEISGWFFILAGVFGGFIRMTLAMFNILSEFGLYASLGDAVFITIGTFIFIIGQIKAE